MFQSHHTSPWFHPSLTAWRMISPLCVIHMVLPCKSNWRTKMLQKEKQTQLRFFSDILQISPKKIHLIHVIQVIHLIHVPKTSQDFDIEKWTSPWKNSSPRASFQPSYTARTVQPPPAPGAVGRIGRDDPSWRWAPRAGWSPNKNGMSWRKKTKRDRQRLQELMFLLHFLYSWLFIAIDLWCIARLGTSPTSIASKQVG